MASGGIDECYEAGDNPRVVTSDAQRNRALSVLGRSYPASIEQLALAVVSDLHQAYPYFPEIKVDVLRHSSQRVGPSYVAGRAAPTEPRPPPGGRYRDPRALTTWRYWLQAGAGSPGLPWTSTRRTRPCRPAPGRAARRSLVAG